MRRAAELAGSNLVIAVVDYDSWNPDDIIGAVSFSLAEAHTRELSMIQKSSTTLAPHTRTYTHTRHAVLLTKDRI